jgi:hypothetical protein
MVPDQTGAKGDPSPSNALHDFLQAFETHGGETADRTRPAAPEPGISEDWGPPHPVHGSRSAREWREDWESHHRPAIKERQNWKVLALGLALVIGVALSIYGVYWIDQVVHEGSVPADLRANHTTPAIHWGGQ